MHHSYYTQKFQHLNLYHPQMSIYANLAYMCLEKCYYCHSPELLLFVTTVITKFHHLTWLALVISNSITSRFTATQYIPATGPSNSHCVDITLANVITSSASSARMGMR